jgi:undecaprenyl-diphosphatase
MQAIIKNLVDGPRPDPTLIEHRASFSSESFPAGHVLSGTAVLVMAAALVGQRIPARARLGLWTTVLVVCALNGVANVYEGVHWPSDVLGGYLWAGVFLLVAWWATHRRTTA